MQSISRLGDYMAKWRGAFEGEVVDEFFVVKICPSDEVVAHEEFNVEDDVSRSLSTSCLSKRRSTGTFVDNDMISLSRTGVWRRMTWATSMSTRSESATSTREGQKLGDPCVGKVRNVDSTVL